MAEKSFRVLLDATDLYLENFKYVWINVSPREFKTICDFKNYVLRKINLERDVQLFVREGLLLEEETIVVLREDDTVKIKYKAPVCQNFLKESLKESANSSRKRNLSESNVSDRDINSKRYKPEVVTLSSNGNGEGEYSVEKKFVKGKKQIESPINSETIYITAVEKKKKKQKLPLNSENVYSTSVKKGKKQAESTANFENFHSTLSEESHKKKKKNKKKSSIICDQTEMMSQMFTDDFCMTDSFYSFNDDCTLQKQNKNNKSSKTVSTDSSSKEVLNIHQKESPKVITDINSEELNSKNVSKRKRHRKRKKNPKTNVTDYHEMINISQSFSENVEENINRKHIVYLSPERIQENNEENVEENINREHIVLSPERIQENNCLNDASEFHNPSTETFVLKEDKLANIRSLDYPKMSTPTQSGNCDVPDWQLSIMPSKDSSLVKCVQSNENDSILHDKPTKSTTQSNTENKPGKQLYEDLPDIDSLPSVGTYIAYKTLELSETYSPSVTDYREGVVERINPDTEELEIRLLKTIILPGRAGKFENLGADEVPEDIVKSYDTLKWSNVFSPKLLSCVPD